MIMDEESQRNSGLLAAATRIVKTLRDVVENRLELFLLEAQEHRLRLVDALCLALVAVVLALMTLILVSFTVVVLFWDTHRLAALTVMTLVYALAATVAFARLRSRLKRWQAFPATLEQLEKDRACFKKRS
jgi:uncharacterized membrane protein YqjE